MRCVDSYFIEEIDDSAIMTHLRNYLLVLPNNAFAVLVTRTEYIRALKFDGTISPKVYDSANQVANSIIRSLQVSIQRGTSNDYRMHPIIMTLFQRQAQSPDASGRSARSPLPKRQRMSSTDSPHTPGQSNPEANKRKGILLYSGPQARSPPSCNVFARSPGSSSNERLCLPFMCQGFACTRVGCKRVHISALSKLPADKQAQLKSFVDASPHLSFAPGRGPAGRASS
ncbi:hypothetical protein SEMRO_92_G048220.1 [Seminavis robusta]|uniref:Uncharacterized protein n=1 Tax=Seminavis robusta TaxID=568900 RepID=A0A9N8DJF5_9STRA|nr:hypothetical protein SEMRO_92_G048220.1 [Seminavis robusta]|eukprot:Sro92_g048220.1 n/a (228) ;mRNA; f:123830-124597